MARYFVVSPEAAPELAIKGIQAKGTALENASARVSTLLPGTVIADLDPATANALLSEGAELFEDIQFKLFDEFAPLHPFWHGSGTGSTTDNLSTVLDKINAPQAWSMTKGAGVTIAIVDTGIAGSVREVPAARRSSLDLDGPNKGKHWTDQHGHGTMCAAIAAGSREAGGLYDGVAPGATVVAVRSQMNASDVFPLYEGLIKAKQANKITGRLVISNSFGEERCKPKLMLPEKHPYLGIVLKAIDEGIVVVCAAGNNHWTTCNFDPTGDGPNTIWGANSHDRVICVGTVDRNGSNQKLPSDHVNSSRGPGEWAGLHRKPDVVAPTYGEVVWGDGYKVFSWWGTSGACPQVAGLAALVLSANPTLTVEQVGDIIRSTAQPLGGPPTCAGAGMIDCAAAVAKAAAS